MAIAYEKLQGLDREKLLAAVEPVLVAHHVEGVELIWGTDSDGWLLQLTVERPGARLPGAGVTIDLCTDLSRDLSTALDAADVIPQRYRLEVGSPGVERQLYGAADYQRFAGQLVKLKLRAPLAGQRVLRGTLHGLDEAGGVSLDTQHGLLSVPLEEISVGRLVFEFGASTRDKGRPKGARPSPRGSGKSPRRPQGESK